MLTVDPPPLWSVSSTGASIVSPHSAVLGLPWRESSPVQRKGRESSAEMGSCLVYVGNSQEVSFGGAEWGATLTVETLDTPMDGIWEIRQSEESRISQGLISTFFHLIPF